MTIKTSDTHPLSVTWIDESLPGKVGLTFAPGKHCRGAYAGGTWKRDLRKDLDRLAEVHQVGLLVCLLQDHELASSIRLATTRPTTRPSRSSATKCGRRKPGFRAATSR